MAPRAAGKAGLETARSRRPADDGPTLSLSPGGRRPVDPPPEAPGRNDARRAMAGAALTKPYRRYPPEPPGLVVFAIVVALVLLFVWSVWR